MAAVAVRLSPTPLLVQLASRAEARQPYCLFGSAIRLPWTGRGCPLTPTALLAELIEDILIDRQAQQPAVALDPALLAFIPSG